MHDYDFLDKGVDFYEAYQNEKRYRKEGIILKVLAVIIIVLVFVALWYTWNK